MRLSTPAGRWVIAATVLGSGMAAIDATVVGIALPSIGRQFHAPLSTLQWVVTGYTLTLSAFLLLGGSLGDHRGRRKMFVVGVVWFCLASAGCAFAPGPDALVVTRVLQGVGAALLTPGSLAIIEASFDPEDRGPAIGAWSGLGGVATAAGPLLGGYLVTAASWRWIFVINLPIGAAVLLLSFRHVPESKDPDAPANLDVLGAALGVIALAGVTYALIEGPTRGWGNASVAGSLAAGILAGVGFVAVERTSPSPMVPPAVLRVRQFNVANAVTFVVYAGLSGVLFLMPVALQVIGHYSPLESGLAFLPLTVIMLVLSSRSGRLATRIGPRLQMSAGPVVVAVGVALLGRVADDQNYLTGVLPAVVVLGLGLAVTVAPLTITALGSLPDEQSGLASAVNNDVARIGGLVAVAILPALAGITGSSYLHPNQLSSEFRSAMWIAASWCLAGGALAAVGIRNPAPAVALPAEPSPEYFHCALEAAPLAVGVGPGSGTGTKTGEG